jgi:hypothetical protein
MRTKTAVAVVLIVFGVLAFAYQGVSYTTLGRESSMGWMRFATQRVLSLPLPPIFGSLALIGGIALVLVDKGDLRSASTR